MEEAERIAAHEHASRKLAVPLPPSLPLPSSPSPLPALPSCHAVCICVCLGVTGAGGAGDFGGGHAAVLPQARLPAGRTLHVQAPPPLASPTRQLEPTTHWHAALLPGPASASPSKPSALQS
eukprot:1349160-Rhodomonas_salina.1